MYISFMEQQCFFGTEPPLTVIVHHFSETRGWCMSRRGASCPLGSYSRLCSVTVALRERWWRMQECLSVGFWLEIDLGTVWINTLMLSHRKKLSRQWFHTLELEYFFVNISLTWFLWTWRSPTGEHTVYGHSGTFPVTNSKSSKSNKTSKMKPGSE